MKLFHSLLIITCIIAKLSSPLGDWVKEMKSKKKSLPTGRLKI